MLNWTRVENKLNLTHLKWEVTKKIIEAVLLVSYSVIIILVVWVLLSAYHTPYDAGYKAGQFSKGFKEGQK